MTSPKYARTTDTNRFYDIPGFEDIKFRSVTSRLNVINKPALVNWSAKMVAEKAAEHPFTSGNKMDYIKFLKDAPREYTQRSQVLGTAVHKAVEEYVKTGIVTDDEILAPYVNTFKDALLHLGMKVVMSEQTVFNPKYHYAGTLDLILDDGVSKWICDIKTGGVYPTASLQLAAYAHATHYLDDTGKVTDNVVFCEGGFVLELKPNKFTVHYVDISDKQFKMFLHVCAVSEWDTETCKNVIFKQAVKTRQREEEKEEKERSKEREVREEERNKNLSSEVGVDRSVELAELLAGLISYNMSSAGFKVKKFNTAQWAKDIEKLHRIDGAPYDQIESVIKWCQKDSFWKSNILSGSKLRAQYPQLVLKMTNDMVAKTISVPDVRFI